MVKFLVKKDFKDIHTGKLYKQDEVHDFTIKRADEIEQNLDSSFLVRKDNKKKK